MLKVKKTSCHCEIAYSYTCWITRMTATMGTLLCISAVAKGTLLCVCCLSNGQCTAVSGRYLPWPRAHYSVCCLSNGQCTAVSGRPLSWPRARYSMSVASAMVSALLFPGALCPGHNGTPIWGRLTLHCLLLRLGFLLCTSSCFFFSSHTFPWTQYGCKF